jgi:serine/threonine protein kinase/Tfp pilus assembly protein PilF
LACFECFEVNLRSGELCKNGVRIRLAEQSFQILAMLLERGGEVVTRQEIQQRLWPNDTVVEFENSINAAIKRLRVALSDSADQPRYIDTLARRGYRWKIPVEWIERSPAEVQPSVAPTAESPGESSASHLLGKRVSHYRVLEILGGGSMGVVYKAEDLKLGRRVALKFLPEELAHDAGAMERFEREARAASALNHPNICTIYEIAEHDGRPFIAMELLEGRTLRDRLAVATSAGEPLSFDEALEVALQISEGLEAAHEKGIIHRDIKPANIFITNKGVIKILDFGIAKLLELGAAADAAERLEVPIEGNTAAASLTQIGQHPGTAAYMSPEQVRGEPLDQRTDLFSFGVTLYEMATGRRAFAGDIPESLHEAILNRTPTPPRELNPDLHVELQDVIQKCLQRDRNLRYQCAAEIRADLEKIKRDKRKPYLRRHSRLFATATLVAVALIAGGLYWHSRRLVALGQKDTIVLADFTNTTGDRVFDDALKQALRIQLHQSPFLDLISERKVNEALKLMARPADDRLTPEVTREVCQRTGSKAMLTGSIAALGSQYVIGVKAMNCDTGDLLAEAQEQAAGKEAVLRALDTAATDLRGKLGESLSSVQKYTTPLAQATTPSLEALQAYSLGVKMDMEKGSTAALPFWKRAVELDPNFARAHAALAICYVNLNEFGRSTEEARKAYELREKVSQRERLAIEGIYFMNATGELEKAAQSYELLQKIYPREYMTYGNLAFIYIDLGNYEKVLEQDREAMRLEPNSVVNYQNLGAAYVNLNRLDDAEAVYKQAEERKMQSEFLIPNRYLLAFLKNDAEQMAQLASDAMGKSGTEDILLAYQADTAAWHGKSKDARELTRRAMDSAERNESKEAAATYQMEAALREVEAGDSGQARADANAAIKLAPNFDILATGALVLARGGDIARAERMAAELDKNFRLNMLLQRYWLPTIHAAVALQRKEPNRAIALLTLASTIELSQATYLSVSLCPAYLRGEAYLMLHDGNAAAAEFQKFREHYGLVGNFPWGALARLGLGRAYVLETATNPAARDKARVAYQDFLALWKEADPDIPVYKEARAEYTLLQ